MDNAEEFYKYAKYHKVGLTADLHSHIIAENGSEKREIKLAEMIERVKAEIAEEKKRLKAE